MLLMAIFSLSVTKVYGRVLYWFSTTTNNPAAFTDTLFQAASMVSYAGNGQNTNFFQFHLRTQGYLHARQQLYPDRLFCCRKYPPLRQTGTHQASLASYAGQTVYIAFLHNSDDDDRLALDDIVVTHETTSAVSNIFANTPSVRMLRNPVSDVFRASLESLRRCFCHLRRTRSVGPHPEAGLFRATGGQANAIEWPVADLAPGCYLFRCKTESGTSVLKFIKN
jgi:hypothetical protein